MKEDKEKKMVLRKPFFFLFLFLASLASWRFILLQRLIPETHTAGRGLE